MQQHFCSGKAISITYSQCESVVLGIQYEMLLVVLPSVVCSALQYFSTLSYKRLDFRKRNVSEQKMFFSFDFMYNFYLKHFSI